MKIQAKTLTGLRAATIILTSLAIASCSKEPAEPLLFDVDSRATNNTQEGWTAVNLDNINGVTFTSVGGLVIDQRDRGTENTDGEGDTANNDMWRDFIFADERRSSPLSTGERGMDIVITGLESDTVYDVRLWAFDEHSGGRNMTWNGNALSLPHSPDPASLDDQVVTFQATSDDEGTLTLEGRIGSPQGPCCNVFVNGFELTEAD